MNSSILTVRAFPANTAHSANIGLMSVSVADVGLTLKQHWANFSLNVKNTIFVKYCLIGQIKDQIKFMNISTEHISQCNQSEPLADAKSSVWKAVLSKSSSHYQDVS